MCDWGGGPNQIYNYLEDRVQKNQKPPIPKQPDKPKNEEPTIIKGTIEPTTKK